MASSSQLTDYDANEFTDNSQDITYVDDLQPCSSNYFTATSQGSVKRKSSWPIGPDLGQLNSPSSRTEIWQAFSKRFIDSVGRTSLNEASCHRIEYSCNYCSHTAKPVAKNKSIISNLWLHLKTKHINEYSALSRRRHKSNEDRQGYKGKWRATQDDIDQFFTTPESTPILSPGLNIYNGNLQDQTRQDALKLIVSRNLPTSLVDASEFWQLIHNLNPSILSISRHTLTADITSAYHKRRIEIRNMLGAQLQSCGRINLTTDCWSSVYDYCAVTAHWIDDDWKMQEVILGVAHLDNPTHDALYLAEKLFEITQSYGITQGILGITRDNASTNDAMLREFELEARRLQKEHHTTKMPWWFSVTSGDTRCMCHIINIAVQAAIKAIGAEPPEHRSASNTERNQANKKMPTDASAMPAKTACYKLRRHICAFNNRRWWKHELRQQAIALDIAPRKLQLDMPVRWGSTHYMFLVSLYMQQAWINVCRLQQDDSSFTDIMLSKDEWKLIKRLAQFFNIFRKATIAMQADSYPTLSKCIPYYITLILDVKRFKADNEDVSIKAACDAAIQKLDNYHTMAVENGSPQAIIAMLVDPRLGFNALKNLYRGDFVSCQVHALEELRKVYEKYKKRREAVQHEESELIHTGDLPSYSKESVDEEWWFVNDKPHETEDEVKRWLRETPASRHTNILNYWKSKQYEYPIIAQIARDYHAIPASSAPSERVFSMGGDIASKKRKRMLPEHLEELLCLRSWGALPEIATETSDLVLDEWEEDANASDLFQ